MTTATINTKTHCYAAEIMWDKEKAKLFRQTMVCAIGRDCFCRVNEYCWLMASAAFMREVRAA